MKSCAQSKPGQLLLRESDPIPEQTTTPQCQPSGETIESSAIDNAAEAIGYANLGVEKGDFGTHSIRSGGAMAMALDDVPPFRIMMIGR
eukprot:scaffold152711_cov36-Cyclotella_meneghiniana.AAC.1